MAQWTRQSVADHPRAAEAAAAAALAAERAYFAVLGGAAVQDWEAQSAGVKIARLCRMRERILGERTLANCVGNAIEAAMADIVVRHEFGVADGDVGAPAAE